MTVSNDINKNTSSSLKSSAFRRLVAARVSNEFSQSMMEISVFALLIAITGQAALAGLSAGIYTICLIGCQIVSGAIVDRVSPSKALRFSSAVQAAAWALILIGALIFHSGIGLYIAVLLGSIIGGTASGLDGPAEFSLTQKIVDKADVQKASAIGQGRENIATLTGSPFAGVLLSIGHYVPLAAQILFSSAATLLVPNSTNKKSSPEGTSDTSSTPDEQSNGGEDEMTAAKGAFAAFLDEVASGFIVVWKDSGLRSIVTISALANVAMAMIPLTLLAHFTTEGISGWRIGVLSSCLSLSMICGAFFAERFADHFSIGQAGICAIMCQLLASIALVFTLHSLWATCIALLAGFFITPLFNAGCVAYTAHVCSEDNQGRVFAASGVPGMILMPISMIVGGFLFDHWGAKPGLVTCILVFAISLALMLATKGIRELPRFKEMAN